MFHVIDVHPGSKRAVPKKCIILYCRSNWSYGCLQNAAIKSANLLYLYVKKVKYIFLNNISSKFVMYNNQIFRNFFVIIHDRITKVPALINKSIIFEPTELSIHLIDLLMSPDTPARVWHLR